MIRVRVAETRDVPRMVAIERACEMASHWPEETYNLLFDEKSPTRMALVAEETGKEVIGFLVALCCGPDWEIENVAVEPETRRQGVGRSLLQALVRFAKQLGAERLLLEVRESNRAALGLYESAGFERIGVRKSYYTSPLEEDAVVMALFPENSSQN